MKRRVYNEATREKALAELATSSIAEVSKKFKVGESTLSKWKAGAKPKKTTEATGVRDAIVFLRHARRTIAKRGEKALEDPVAGYVLLALNTLEGRA